MIYEEHLSASGIEITRGEGFELKQCLTRLEHGKSWNKKSATPVLEEITDELHDHHKRLYANDNHSILIIFQAMDAAGKDSTIHHVFKGLYPQAVEVYNFKAPSDKELDHDFLWRSMSCLPERGRISVFNRSYYEEVLVTRVHPEYILRQRIPGIQALEDITEDFWQHRYRSIRDHEAHLAQNGTLVLKFFLHVSREEQKRRFLERIDDPEKNWKFSFNDLKERARWEDYMFAFEQAIKHTAQAHAPWYVVPADDPWTMRIMVAEILLKVMQGLKLSYPELSEEEKAKLSEASSLLQNET